MEHCIIIPYGAQMLVAISTCAPLGYAISAFKIIPLLFYPFLLCLSSLLFILTGNKASHFVCLQREPTFFRRWALGVNASAIPV